MNAMIGRHTVPFHAILCSDYARNKAWACPAALCSAAGSTKFMSPSVLVRQQPAMLINYNMIDALKSRKDRPLRRDSR